jgi:hypothetical protein
MYQYNNDLDFLDAESKPGYTKLRINSDDFYINLLNKREKFNSNINTGEITTIETILKTTDDLTNFFYSFLREDQDDEGEYIEELITVIKNSIYPLKLTITKNENNYTVNCYDTLQDGKPNRKHDVFNLAIQSSEIFKSKPSSFEFKGDTTIIKTEVSSFINFIYDFFDRKNPELGVSKAALTTCIIQTYEHLEEFISAVVYWKSYKIKNFRDFYND